MKYLDLTFPDPAGNLAADEALLDVAEAGSGGKLLRFWEPTAPFVVLGYANRAAQEVDLDACSVRGVGVFRRCTGGGTVLQGPGCLNYTLILPIAEVGDLATITGTNRFIMERQRAALQSLVAGSVGIAGHTDLVLGELKFSGNAQRRKRRFLISHGTFLLHFDLESIAACLRMPSQQPDYRRNRPHTDFLTNLEVPSAQLKAALRAAWSAEEVLTSVPAAEIAALAEGRYSSGEWNRRL